MQSLNCSSIPVSCLSHLFSAYKGGGENKTNAMSAHREWRRHPSLSVAGQLRSLLPITLSITLSTKILTVQECEELLEHSVLETGSAELQSARDRFNHTRILTR